MSAIAYHFSAAPVTRGKGHSAVKTAAYVSRSQLRDERTGTLSPDYSRRADLLFEGVFAPRDAPAWAKDRARLWNEVERREDLSTRAADAQLARRLHLALPHQLTGEQREFLVKDFVREQFVRKGMVADVAIHAPHDHGDERNHHAHVLLTLRELTPEGFGNKARDWNGKRQLEQWRERYAEMGARALERAGFQLEAERWRHGHKTLAKQRVAALQRGDVEYAQACDHEATKHLGPCAAALKRREIETDRYAELKETEGRAAELRGLKQDARIIDLEIEREKRGLVQRGPEEGDRPSARFRAEPVVEEDRTPEREAAPPRDGMDAPIRERPAPIMDGRAEDMDGKRVAGKALDGMTDLAGKAIETIASLFESLFEGPKPPPTREEIVRAEEKADARARDERLEAMRRETEDLQRRAAERREQREEDRRRWGREGGRERGRDDDRGK